MVRFAIATPKKNHGNEQVMVETPNVSGRNSVLRVEIAARIPAQGPRYIIMFMTRHKSPATVATTSVIVKRAYRQKTAVANTTGE
jgi:hypothetical protein